MQPAAQFGLICTLLAAVLVAQRAPAQQPGPRFEPSQINSARLRWMQYKMVTGRIVASSPYAEGMNISFGPSTLRGALREQLQILILKNQVSVRYELAGDGEELKIVLSEGGQFAIRRNSERSGLSLDFLQRPDKPLLLLVATDEGRRLIVGDSFWHLYIAAPDLVRDELVPHLELLRPSWQLAATGAAIEQQLLSQAQAVGTPDRQDWPQLVEQLASAEFAVREQAQRELYRQGQVILPYLQSLDRHALDAEQAARVEQLISELAVEYEDTAGRIAAWLAGDPRVWLSIAERPQAAKRRLAARQLERLWGADFDPDADAQTRRGQLSHLRVKWARRDRGDDAEPSAADASKTIDGGR